MTDATATLTRSLRLTDADLELILAGLEVLADSAEPDTRRSTGEECAAAQSVVRDSRSLRRKLKPFAGGAVLEVSFVD